MPRLRPAVLACLPVALVAACTGGADSPAEPATSVPQPWLEAADAGWSDSDGHGSSAPVLSGDACVLTDEVAAHGQRGSSDMSGWGPYGDDPSAADAYRYVCEFRGDELSAQLQLIRTPSAGDARRTVELFLDQGSGRDQENEGTTVEVAGADVQVNHRWYPKTGYGEVAALLHDEDAGALVQLEVSSLDEAAFDAYTAEQAATDLLTQLGRG